jgi:hypothetical protein
MYFPNKVPNTRFYIDAYMKKISFTLLFYIMVSVCGLQATTFQTTCTYQRLLSAEEFPIGILLSWSTVVENNNSMFILEKSDNGTDYQTAGTIRGAGTSTVLKEYHFLDPQAFSLKIFYRLKQVDFDGTFHYSETLSIDKKIETNVLLVQLSSETVLKNFDFTADAMKDGGVVLQLVNGANKIVWQGTQMFTYGLNNISIDLSPYREGVYKVVVIMDKDEKILTIRKVDDGLARHSGATDKKRAGRN